MTQRGIWVLLLVCSFEAGVSLCAFRSRRDRRIVLSQKQYDKYLYQLTGEHQGEVRLDFGGI